MNYKTTLIALFSFGMLASAACSDDENKDPYLIDNEPDKVWSDSALTLVNVVNTGLCYNESDFAEKFQGKPKMERVGDTLNVYVAAHANQVTDSMTVRYYTQGNKLLVYASPYFDPKAYYAQALCILTRKLQFVGKVDVDYELSTGNQVAVGWLDR